MPPNIAMGKALRRECTLAPQSASSSTCAAGAEIARFGPRFEVIQEDHRRIVEAFVLGQGGVGTVVEIQLGEGEPITNGGSFSFLAIFLSLGSFLL